MFQFAINTASLFHPLLQPLRFVGASSILALFAWSILSSARDVIARAKEMHKIPCTKCQFFTGDYRLKCTVNPHAANTEQAIGCPDCQAQSFL